MQILETERLILREFTIHDSGFIFEIVNDPSWLQFIGDRNVKSESDAQKYITDKILSSYSKFGFGLYMTELKKDQTPIGMCGLVKRESLSDVDIGFAFLPEYSKKGFAYEAASAILKFAENTLNLKRILAITVPNNTNAIKLLKRLNMQFEKIIRFADDEKELMMFAKHILSGRVVPKEFR